jgi:hypothetical protein
MATYGRAIMPNYNRDMSAAPLDELVLLLVPTGDPTYPIAIEIGNWDAKELRFLGNWRWCDDEAGNYPNADPIAWREIPEIDADIAAVFATRATRLTLASGTPLQFSEMPAAA